MSKAQKIGNINTGRKYYEVQYNPSSGEVYYQSRDWLDGPQKAAGTAKSEAEAMQKAREAISKDPDAR